MLKIARNLSVVLSLLVVCACSGRSKLKPGEIPSAQIPSRQAILQTKSIIEQELKDNEGFHILERGKSHARVEKIVKRLATAAGVSNFSYPVFIADAGDQANAMAVNSTSIVVYQALLDRVKSDDELATVISHEVGHLLAKHTDDDTSDSRQSWVDVGSSVLGLAAGVAAIYAGGTAEIISDDIADAAEGVSSYVGTGALVRAYDRDMESEADQIGLILMAKAGYNPEAAISFWQKADQIFGERSGDSFLSTHPAPGNRAEALRKLLPEAQKYYQLAKGAKK